MLCIGKDASDISQGGPQLKNMGRGRKLRPHGARREHARFANKMRTCLHCAMWTGGTFSGGMDSLDHRFALRVYVVEEIEPTGTIQSTQPHSE